MTKAKASASKRSFLFKRVSAAVNYFMIFSMLFYTLIPALKVSAEEVSSAEAAALSVSEASAPASSETTVSAPSETAAVSAPAETPASAEVSAPAETSSVSETPAAETQASAETATPVNETAAVGPTSEPLIEPLVIEEPIVVENLTNNSVSTPAVILEPTVDTTIASSTEAVAATSTEEIIPDSKNVNQTPEVLKPVVDNKILVSEKVELGKTYVAPQNNAVTVTFTKLPENPGSLFIEEVTLTPEQVTELGALSNVAYDITSSMEDGTFECNVTLPIPAGETDVQIKNAEDVAGLSSAEVMPTADVEVSGDTATVSSNHFTIFVASKLIASSETTVIFGKSTYYVKAGVDSLIDDIEFTNKIPLNLRFVFTRGDTKIIGNISSDWDWHNWQFVHKVGANLPVGKYAVGAEYCKTYNRRGDCVDWKNISGSSLVYSIDTPSIEFVVPVKGNNYFRSSDNPLRVKVSNEFNQIRKVKFKIKEIVDDKDGHHKGVSIVKPKSEPKSYTFTVDADKCEEADGYLLCDVNKSDSWLPKLPNGLKEGEYSAQARAYTKADKDDERDDDEGDFEISKCDNGNGENKWIDSINFFIDSTDPEISNLTIETEPYNYTPKVYVYSKSLTISAEASDNQEVKNVDFYLTEPTSGVCDGIGPILPGMENIVAKKDTDGRYRTTFDTSALNGSYCINAKAEDLAGSHSETAKSTVILDNTAPRVEITNPTEGAIFSSAITSVIDIRGTIQDVNPHHYWLVVENNSGTKVAGPDVVNDSTSFTNKSLFSWNIAGVPSGTYKIKLEARDAAGNKGAESITSKTVIIDNTAPTVPTLSFIDRVNHYNLPCGGATNAQNITVDWADAADANGIAGYDYQINYPQLDGTRGIWNQSLVPSEYTGSLNEGIHYVKVRARDNAGNVSAWSSECAITLDTKAPTATFKHYINGVEFTGAIARVNNVNKLSFTGEYRDAEPSSGLLKDSYVIFDAQKDGSFAFMNNGAKAYCGWRQAPNLVEGLSGTSTSVTEKVSFTNCISSLPDGEYYMSHQVYDHAIRKDIPSITQFRDVLGLHFIIDKTAPEVPTPLYPENGSVRTSAEQDKIDWTDVTDPSLPVTYIYESSNASTTNEDGSFVAKAYVSGPLTNSEIPTPGTPAGTYYWHVKAADALGNTSAWSVTWSVTVDNSEKEITDSDRDEVPDSSDNCPTVWNPSQVDKNGNGIGDACEETPVIDTDDDGIADNADNCPTVANPDQADTNKNGVGDACEETPVIDTDDDGVNDEVDNCPTVANPDQADTNKNGVGDACETQTENKALGVQAFGVGSFTPDCRDVMYTCIDKKVVLVNPTITQYCALTPKQQAKLDAPCEENGGQQQVLGIQRYSVGTLLRSKSTFKIYIVTAENVLKHIVSLKELWQYRNKSVLSVDESVIASYSQVLGDKKYADGTLVRSKSDHKIYVIINGEKVHIKTLKDLLKYFGHPILEIE